MAAPDIPLEDRYQHLVSIVRDMGSVVVGFSGGADSTLLMKVAADQLGERAIAVTAVSPSYPERDRREAIDLASLVGARHLLVDSHEFEDPGYIANEPNRCFFCKRELFDILRATAREHGFETIAYGAITDDLGDFRPGMEAARQAGARAPLLEAGFSKQDVREISRRLGLRTWDRPAAACLSSRIPHGTPIDPAQLGRVERCEDFLIARGFHQVRVRAHGEIARIECRPEDLPRLVEPLLRATLAERFKEAGFRYVTVDLEGYRTGSLNPIPGESD
ncbi:MAG TPA: ATP-dependent sacrificial sulfur transferase LarE [Candidatus Polarisedimenticolia bacterium]|jgi:uncharacterized protein